jgi:hypothetical protein
VRLEGFPCRRMSDQTVRLTPALIAQALGVIPSGLKRMRSS